jgi:hypothetical protein
MSTVDLDGAIASGKIELAAGDKQETIDAFAMFDKFEPSRNYKIGPLEY